MSRAVPLTAVLVALLLAPVLALAQAPDEPPSAAPPTPEVLDQRPARGEQCIVCRVRVHEGDIVEVRYKGRNFHVAEKMLAQFEADPDAYFHLMQAHGGLFDEAAMEMPSMRIGWLVFGLYVLVGLVAGAACSYVAIDRGLPARGWFFAGLAVNVIALAAVLTRKGRADALGEPAAGLAKIPTTRSPVACRHCGAANHPAAAACGECGRALEPSVEAETARA